MRKGNHRWGLLVAAWFMIVAACGGGPTVTTLPGAQELSYFLGGVDSQATCARLVKLAEAIESGSDARLEAKEALAEVGCDSPDSVRTDIVRTSVAPKPPASESEKTCPGSQRLVTYFVEGSASGTDITINNRQGNTEQASNRSVPLTANGKSGLRIGCVEAGFFYYISAQNTGETGTITCRVEVDGREMSAATSVGAYVIASCSGSTP